MLAAASPAEQTATQPTPSTAMDRLSGIGEQELSKSVQELNELRAQIQKEKVPLAEELTSLEAKVAQLRKDQGNVTRQVDTGNLELTGIKAETKARQDELAYIGNLLDEYARTFETKVNVCEMQYCTAAVELAKQAPANTTLSMAEKFQRQVALVDLSVKRLFDVIGGTRFAAVGVDLKGAVVEGQVAIVGPVAVFRGVNGAAGLVVPQTGSAKPLIRPLEGPIQAGLDSLVAKGEGLLPLDPTRGAALKALVQKTNLIHIFEKGGPIMWPLLLASTLALGTVLERLIFLLGEKFRRNPKAVTELLAAVREGDLDRAISIGTEAKYYVVRVLAYALEHKEKSLPDALQYATGREIKRFRRGIPVLDTVITLAPLLGLLGTVTGMMGSFSMLGGELSGPTAITGGIAEALIATAFGLGIAITSLLPFNLLNNRMEEARHEIEAASTQLELLLQGTPAPAPASAGGGQRRVGFQPPSAAAASFGVVGTVLPEDEPATAVGTYVALSSQSNQAMEKQPCTDLQAAHRA